MKKALKILGGIVGLLIVAMLVIPLVVDVDKYRPQIIKAANEQLNGTLELGKLKLSLWGRVSVQVAGLNLSDSQRRSIVAVKDASFDIPFTSVLAGSPLITLHLVEPAINVTKDKDGKMNVMTLMKAQSAASTPAGGAAGTAVTQPAAGSQKLELPGIAMNARFGVLIENAKITYKDEAMNLSNTIDQLNLRVKDFSLTRKTSVELWADLKTTMGSDLKVEGPIKFLADLTPEVSGGEFKSASLDANFTADDLTIEKGTLFHKKKGAAMNFKFKGKLGQDSMKLDEAALHFHNAEITVSGNYLKATGADIKFGTKPITLNSWSELIPMLKEYELDGALSLDGTVKGKPEAIQYTANLGVKDLSMKGPNLKAKPVINAQIDVITDQIQKIYVDLKGPGNELVLNGKMVSFTKPQLTFDLKSPKGLDLDQWIEFPKETEAKAAPAASGGAAGGAKGEATASADYDALVEPLRKNEMMREMGVDGNVDIAMLKAKGVKIDAITAKIMMKNLVMGIPKFALKTFDGSVAGGFTTDLKPKQPQYNMNLVVSGLDIQKAVESQFQSMKNTLTGKLSCTVQGGGASFNPAPAKQHLQMKGDFKVVNAQFKTMDIAKMANDAISGSLSKIASKVPMLAGKKVNASSNSGSKYDLISGNFTISNGVLDAPNFSAKAAAKAGIDIRGATKMGLIDESLDAKWELIDTQHMTGADQLNANVAGKDIKNILAKNEKDPVTIPITVGCKWSAPCPNYSQLPEYFAGIALGRLSHAVPEVAKQKVMDAVKQGLPGGLKKLFGH